MECVGPPGRGGGHPSSNQQQWNWAWRTTSAWFGQAAIQCRCSQQSVDVKKNQKKRNKKSKKIKRKKETEFNEKIRQKSAQEGGLPPHQGQKAQVDGQQKRKVAYHLQRKKKRTSSLGWLAALAWLLWLGWLWLSVPSAPAESAAPLQGPTRAPCRNHSQYVMPWFANNDLLVCKWCSAWHSNQVPELQLGFSNEVSLRLSNLWVNRFFEMAWQLVAVLVITEFWGFSVVWSWLPRFKRKRKIRFVFACRLAKLARHRQRARFKKKGFRWSPKGGKNGNQKTRAHQ